MGEIRIGTSGWSYPSGRGSWNGVFYPAPRPRGFDDLAFYADRFDTVEVNSTFYRMPEAAQTAKWLERTPRHFLFSVKLFQKFTHPEMFLRRDGVAGWDLSRVDVDLFRAGLEPLADAGRLGALLIQFPPSFHRGDAERAYVDWLLSAFRPYPRAVELRHRSWTDAGAATQAQLASEQTAWVAIDEPKFAGSAGPSLTVEAPLEYIRLHGRNAARWWEHANSEDRYDYLYSAAELAPFAGAARTAADAGRRVLLYLNNHFSAKAVANAAVLKHELEQPVPDLPDALVKTYPELQPIAPRPSGGRAPARSLFDRD